MASDRQSSHVETSLEPLCVRFEEECRQGKQPRIEEYLRAAPSTNQEQFFLELLSTELSQRIRLGESCRPEEYASRFPDFQALLQEAFEQVSDSGGAVTRVPPKRKPREQGFAAGTIVRDYEIEAVLGSGGMGIVYRARQLTLRRTVALKMIRFEEDDQSVLSRFQLEAEAIAQLQHPHIVQVFEIGQHEGRPFFSLEYVEGGSLADQLKRSLPPLRQAATLLATLASAMHHAHARGIVHRDLKPGNVLLQATSAPERNSTQPATGPNPWTWTPKITDFGLAKNLNATQVEALTVKGDVLGTPSYMSPEQAAGNMDEVGPASDIYALGAILYEMLTGRPPFQSKSVLDLIRQVLHEPPVPPRRLRNSLPSDLETICLRCLEKEPGQRYASAESLAADLNAFLAGGAIQAQPLGLAARLRRAILRRPALGLSAAIGVLAAGSLVVGLFWFNELAVVGLAVLSMLFGLAWYGARLQTALLRSKREHIRAERNAQRLFSLLEVTQRLVTVTSSDELLRILSEAITRLLDAERATIYLLDEERRELWSKVTLGVEAGDIRVPLGQGIAGTVALSGETLRLANPYADPRFNQEVDRRTGYVTRNLLTLPMVTRRGKIVGVFQVLNKRGESFTQEDAEILSALALSAARSVEGK